MGEISQRLENVTSEHKPLMNASVNNPVELQKVMLFMR